MVSGSCALLPRWPPQCSCVVIESSFDPGERLQAPGSLWLAHLAKGNELLPSLGVCRPLTFHILIVSSAEPPDTIMEENQPSNDYFIKILFLLSRWFQTRRFLWEFQIGSYVKLSSAVVAIMVGGLKCQT
jgi:hypothetical protein